MKRILGIIAIVGTALPAFVIGQGMPPTLVETSPVVSMEFHDQVTLIGRTEAESESRIVAEVGGRVVSVEALEGNPVKKGQVLLSIDSRRAQHALDAKLAQVAQAEAAATLAGKELERITNLHARELASDGGYDAAVSDHTRAVEWHNQLLAEAQTLQLDRDNCSIRAPFDGYTVRRLVDVGEFVVPGTPVFDVVNLNQIRVTVDLPERYFGRVVVGSEVAIRVSGNMDGNGPAGRVTGFAPSASQETHTFPVIVTVDNKNGALGSGMLIRATLSLDAVFQSLAVHKDAIVRQGSQTMVYTINEGAAAPIPVVVSSMAGDMVAIKGDGVAEGMPVVVRGNERIFPGSPVRTADAPPGGAPPAAEDASSDQATTKSTSGD